MLAIPSSVRSLTSQRGRIASRLPTTNAALNPQIDSSTTWPRFDVVSTEYHEQTSATAISGTSVAATARTALLPAECAIARNHRVHCPTKHSSATVATERPTMTLQSQESKMQTRGTSNTRKTERKA